MLKIHGWKLSVWHWIIEVNSGHHPTDTGSDKYGVMVVSSFRAVFFVDKHTQPIAIIIKSLLSRKTHSAEKASKTNHNNPIIIYLLRSIHAYANHVQYRSNPTAAAALPRNRRP